MGDDSGPQTRLPSSGELLDRAQRTKWTRIQLGKVQMFSPDGRHSTLPTRLLDLSNDTHVRLVESSSEQLVTSSSSPIRYVALSHRWGASQHLIATGNTMQHLYYGLEVTALPQTFRDAVFFARYLGFQYMWIDALCSIQDSPDDWHQESLKMGDIFMCADLTFAIHCASDDSEGFLARAFAERPVIYHKVDGTVVGVCQPADPEVDITNSGLSRRGWVRTSEYVAIVGRALIVRHLYRLCKSDSLPRGRPLHLWPDVLGNGRRCLARG